MRNDLPTYHDPPVRTMEFLRWFCAEQYLEEVEGDLFELFQEEVETYGIDRARKRFFWTAVRYIRPFFFGSKDISLHLDYQQAMFRHYFKISTRHLFKQPVFSFINISGLAIGMACCIAVLLFIHDETSYDQYHEKEQTLYRLSNRSILMSSGDESLSATTPILWGPALKKDFPEILDFTRFVKLADSENPWELTLGKEKFFESELLYTDPATLRLFSWPLLQGDPKTALDDPFSIVITKSIAQKYFAGAEVIGSTITIDPRLRNNDGSLTGQTFEFTVTGVMQDIPDRSHFHFNFLLPSVGLNNVYDGDINSGAGLDSWYWRGNVAHTYLHLKPGTDPEALAAKLPEFQDRYLGDATRSRGYYYLPHLQKINEIYLAGNYYNQLAPAGSRDYIFFFSLIALFVMLIACINFMNLSTARSTVRAKEVGLRKVVGAFRRQLISQFLSESVLISVIAFVIGLGLASLIMPVLYEYLDKEFSMDFGKEFPFIGRLFLLALLTGLVAGSYPAFILSRFRPVQVLKGLIPGKAKGAVLRQGLIVFQFALSAFLIIVTLTLFRQLSFMRSHHLGFDQERQVVLLPNDTRPLARHYEVIRDELRNGPYVQDVTLTSGVPGVGGGGELYVAKGAPAEDGFGLIECLVDYNYVDLFGLELVAGRNFSDQLGTDAGRRDENGRLREVKAILNEEAVRSFGWASPEEAIGKQIIRDPHAADWTAEVIGVMKDFHFQTLREPITPAALFLASNSNYMVFKLASGNIQPALAAIEAQVRKFDPESAFDYRFLDEAFQEQYFFEERLGRVFSYASTLAIIIACLGLFGLAAFTTSRRFKEIGIRKTLGATPSQIVLLLSQGFTKLVIIATFIAIPAAYLATERGLAFFAYRIDFNIWIYLAALVLSVLIAFLTVGFQTLKAAQTNPVESLKVE